MAVTVPVSVKFAVAVLPSPAAFHETVRVLPDVETDGPWT
jgi:hypothetical protein